MKNIMILILTFFIFHSESKAMDVIGNKEIIVVSKNNLNKINFHHCQLNEQKIILTKSCNVIGSKIDYSIDELEQIRRNEWIEAYAKSILDVGIVLGVATAAFYLAPEAAILAAPLLSASSQVITIVALAMVNHLNPVVQFKQAHALDQKLINDLDSRATDADILKTVDLLNEIL